MLVKYGYRSYNKQASQHVQLSDASANFMQVIYIKILVPYNKFSTRNKLIAS
jgi:hypothetical protein